AKYLDKKTSEIDQIIDAKKKLIALYNEEKSALINRAVTKGIDDKAKLKPSGVEWLGDIPQHWEVKKLKQVANMRSSNVDKKTKENEKKIELCNYVDVYKNDFIDSSISFMKASASDEQIKNFILSKGDVILTKDSESPDDIAIPALVIEDFDNVICGYHLAHIKPINILGGLLFRMLQSKFYKSYFKVASNGVTRYGIGIDKFNSVPILLPPLEEQEKILGYIEKNVSVIDKKVANAKRLIELMTEYRTTLISEVVTGKVKVV
ncbi:MAG: restriction endonuclease subunit S, partial [Candidatus Kapaibacterium sp.]